MMNVIKAGVILATLGSAAHAAERTYAFSDFDQLTVAAGVTVNVTHSTDFSVTAQALLGDIKRLDIAMDGDSLDISRRSRWLMFGLRKEDRFVVDITMPVLEEIDVKQGASVSVGMFESEDFSAQTASGSTLNIEKVQSDEVDLRAVSGSTLRVSGGCRELDASASSGASLIADGLDCAMVDADAGSGASLNVSASQTVKAVASSGASVNVSGNPTDKDVTENSGGRVTVK